MKTKEERDAYIAKIANELAEAYSKIEEERDEAAIFILNNFEKVLSLFTERNSERSEKGLYDLRMIFWNRSQS